MIEIVFFIARDGETFKYVLEHLTYGQIISEIDESMLKKLEVDAKFYILPRLQTEVALLKKQVVKQDGKDVGISSKLGEITSIFEKYISLQKIQEQCLKEKQDGKDASISSKLGDITSIFEKYISLQTPKVKEKIFLRVQSSATVTNGTWFNWNVSKEVPNSHFKLDGNSITVLQTGLYQIFVRYVSTCSTSGNGSANIDLYVSNSVVARFYHGQGHGYQTSGGLTEIMPLKANDTVMVKYFSNSNGVADQVANTLSILLLD